MNQPPGVTVVAGIIFGREKYVKSYEKHLLEMVDIWFRWRDESFE